MSRKAAKEQNNQVVGIENILNMKGLRSSNETT